MATVDAEYLAGDEGRLGPDEVAHGCRDVIDRADAAERHLHEVVVEERAARGDEGHQFVVDDPRGDSVDADAERPELLGRRLGQEADPRLRDAVGPQVRVREAPGTRRHEHDGAGSTLRLHGRRPLLHADDRAHQVQVDGGAHGGHVGGQDGADVGRTARAGEQAVDAPGRLGRRATAARDLLLHGDVGHHVARRRSRRRPRRDARRRVGELLLGAPADRDVRALCCEVLRRGQPDAAAAPGDEDRPAGDPGATPAAPVRTGAGARSPSVIRRGQRRPAPSA